MAEARPLIRSKRGDYVRAAATKDVSIFCGWDYLLDLIKQVDVLDKTLAEKKKAWTERALELERRGVKSVYTLLGYPPPSLKGGSEAPVLHKGAISVLFLTGCRIREILGIVKDGQVVVAPMRATNFRLDLDDDYIYVESCPVLKRYKKLDHDVIIAPKPEDTSPSHAHLWHYDKELKQFVRRVWSTRRLTETRTFFFRKDEPLVKYLLDLLEVRKNAPCILPYSYSYWYRFLRLLDPMKDKYQGRVKWRWIYPHWFRAQRVSQLATDYGLDLFEIAQWGEWRSVGVVNAYAGLTGVIKRKMSDSKTRKLDV